MKDNRKKEKSLKMAFARVKVFGNRSESRGKSSEFLWHTVNLEFLRRSFHSFSFQVLTGCESARQRFMMKSKNEWNLKASKVLVMADGGRLSGSPLDLNGWERETFMASYKSSFRRFIRNCFHFSFVSIQQSIEELHDMQNNKTMYHDGSRKPLKWAE
jgi:hypothetical protein